MLSQREQAFSECPPASDAVAPHIGDSWIEAWMDGVLNVRRDREIRSDDVLI
jgi:hypothetical protein